MLGKSQEVSRMAYYHPLSFSVHNTLVYLWYYYRNSSPIKVQRYSSFLTLFPPEIQSFKSAAKGSYSRKGFCTEKHYIAKVPIPTHFCSHFSALLSPCCWLAEVDATSHLPEVKPVSVALCRNKPKFLPAYTAPLGATVLCDSSDWFCLSRK